MSKLVPNLDDLRELLPPPGSAPDAHTFLDRLSQAETVEDAVAQIDALVAEWLTVPE